MDFFVKQSDFVMIFIIRIVVRLITKMCVNTYVPSNCPKVPFALVKAYFNASNK